MEPDQFKAILFQKSLTYARVTAHRENMKKWLSKPLTIQILMEEMTEELVFMYPGIWSYLYVFYDGETHTYPDDRHAKAALSKIQGQYGAGAQSLTEMKAFDERSIIAPIRESESEPPFAVLRLVAEEKHFDFSDVRRELTNFWDDYTVAMRKAFIDERHAEAQRFGGLIGGSPLMQEIKNQILQAAKTDFPVLIQGDTGTGKELTAKAIRENSNRKGKPYVSLSCAALSETLIEAELFGYGPKSGLPNADLRGKPGLFEQANGGTIFLDEVGEMPSSQQVKLLRVLEEGKIRRTLDTQTREVDVRVIAATNRNLRHQVEIGAFRQDLFARFNVLTITLPPLRERKADILPLAQYFLHEKYKAEGEGKYFTPEVENALMTYDWPENVRQLENAVKRAIAVSTGEITVDHLPIEITQPQSGSPTHETRPTPPDAGIEPFVRQFVAATELLFRQLFGEERARWNGRPTEIGGPLERLLATPAFVRAVSDLDFERARSEFEMFFITYVLDQCHGTKSKAAELLKVSRTFIDNRCKGKTKENPLHAIEQ